MFETWTCFQVRNLNWIYEFASISKFCQHFQSQERFETLKDLQSWNEIFLMHFYSSQKYTMPLSDKGLVYIGDILWRNREYFRHFYLPWSPWVMGCKWHNDTQHNVLICDTQH